MLGRLEGTSLGTEVGAALVDGLPVGKALRDGLSVIVGAPVVGTTLGV